MKKLSYFLAGVGCTLICTTLVVPALAAQFEATFNSINIQSDGRTVANAGESFSLADGSQVPYSILYNGTTYLPMRKVAEMVNKDVAYNNETRTANLVKKGEGEVVDNNTDNIIDNFKKYTINGKECIKLTDITDNTMGYKIMGPAVGAAKKDSSDFYGYFEIMPNTKGSHIQLAHIPLVFSGSPANDNNLAYIELSTFDNIISFCQKYKDFYTEKYLVVPYDEFVSTLK